MTRSTKVQGSSWSTAGCGLFGVAALAVAAALVVPAPPAAAQAWEPTKPITFIIPAGTGGGADQMARFIQGAVAKNNLAKQPMITVNKAGGAGAEGFLEVKKSAGDAHTIIITLSNLFTTPNATGVPFSWKDMTPVAMLALDQFVLWVNSEASYTTAKEYIDAVKAGDDKSFKMGGTGSKQEDQIITAALERLTAPKKFTYIPYAGGGAVAVQLVGKHVNSTVNNPIEAVSQWKAGALRPLCIFDGKRSIYTQKVTSTMAWSDIPTCQEVRGQYRVPDAARHLHAAGRQGRARRLLRRSVQEGDGDGRLEEVHGGWRLQSNLHERRRVQDLGRSQRPAPLRPDEGSGLPGARQVSWAGPVPMMAAPVPLP